MAMRQFGLGGYGRGKPIKPKPTPTLLPGEEMGTGNIDFDEYVKFCKRCKTVPKENFGFQGNRIEIEAQKLTRPGMFGSYDKVRGIDMCVSDFLGAITYLENPNYFCVESRTMNLWKLKHEYKLHLEVEDEGDDLKLDHEVNYTDQACAVKSQGKWRRGYVMRTNWPTMPDNDHEYIAEIMLVDSGHYGFERMTEMRALPDKWLRPPPMTYRSTMEGPLYYTDQGDKWPPKIIKEFREMVKGPFTAIFRDWRFGAMDLRVFPSSHHECNVCRNGPKYCSVNDIIWHLIEECKANERRGDYSHWNVPEPPKNPQQGIVAGQEEAGPYWASVWA